jgi:hypothetical protein
MRFSRLHLQIAKLKHAAKAWVRPPKGSPVCARCYRAGYVKIRTAQGEVEWRCDWHVSERVPTSVLRSEFNCRASDGRV